MAGERAARGIVAAALLAALSCAEKPPPPTIGEPAPEFELESLDGSVVRLSDYRGRVVVLNFWATWCPPCVDEMPSLDRLAKALGAKGLVVLAASVDHRREDVEAFRERHGLGITILHDVGARVSRRYQTFKYPETYVIDREGRLVRKIIGPRDWIAPEMIHDLVELLKQGEAL